MFLVSFNNKYSTYLDLKNDFYNVYYIYIYVVMWVRVCEYVYVGMRIWVRMCVWINLIGNYRIFKNYLLNKSFEICNTK